MAVAVVAMAATFLFLLLLLLSLAHPAPAVLSATIGKSSAREEVLRPVIKESAKVYMEQKAQRAVTTDRDVQQTTDSSSGGVLVFDLSIGTSPQKLSVLMDITTELIWAECDSCPSCIRLTPPETLTFLPNKSDSFHAVACASQTCRRMIPGERGCHHDDDPCGYPDNLHAAWNTSGVLATDTFTLGTTPVQGVVFGCSGDVMVQDLAGASGVAGFSRGPLSLVSQLNISSFTYFIAPPGDAAGKSFVSWSWAADHEFAAGSVLTGGRRRSSTPLLAATKNQINPDLYYVKLTGLQVDGQLLTAIPPGTFDVRPDGSGGVALSSTLPVTYLEDAAYKVLRQELAGRISVAPVSAAGDDDDVNHLCFLTSDFSSNAKVPGLALVFDSANATMELNVENYFFAVDGGQLTCLTILPSTGGSILGSLLQAGRTMTYDIHGGQLTFQTASAGAAPAPAVCCWLMAMSTLLVWVLAP